MLKLTENWKTGRTKETEKNGASGKHLAKW